MNWKQRRKIDVSALLDDGAITHECRSIRPNPPKLKKTQKNKNVVLKVSSTFKNKTENPSLWLELKIERTFP